MEKVPDWAIERAKEVIDAFYTVDALTNVARYIAEHEKPPADADLLIAREAAGQINDEDDCPISAGFYRSGEHDDTDEIRVAVRTIKLAREKGAL